MFKWGEKGVRIAQVCSVDGYVGVGCLCEAAYQSWSVWGGMRPSSCNFL